MNNLTLVGKVGKDAEVRSTNSGDKITTFSVADDQGYGDSKKTVWWACSFWGERGAKVAGYIRKGDNIAVVGVASTRTWTAGDGTEKTNLECRVNDVTLLGGKRDDRQATPPRSGGSGYAMPNEDLDDSIPF